MLDAQKYKTNEELMAGIYLTAPVREINGRFDGKTEAWW